MTHERETAGSIDDAASEWAARLDRGLNEDEQEALEAWLAGDVRRVGALARARALWCHAGEAIPATAPAAQPAPPPRAPLMTRRRMVIGGSIAAALAGGLLVRGLLPDGASLESGVGEVRRIALEDGSAVTLGPGTQIRRSFDAARRLVEVIAGTAFFEVAHDPVRPFMVLARGLTVRAVGAAFSVRAIEGLPVAVVVARGSVKFARAASSGRLGAEMQLEMPAEGAPTTAKLEPEAVERALAWRDGMLSFEGESLATVARRFNDYGAVRIEIADPALAREPITGLFAANDPRGFATAIAASLDARVESAGDTVRITRK